MPLEEIAGPSFPLFFHSSLKLSRLNPQHKPINVKNLIAPSLKMGNNMERTILKHLEDLVSQSQPVNETQQPSARATEVGWLKWGGGTRTDPSQLPHAAWHQLQWVHSEEGGRL